MANVNEGGNGDPGLGLGGAPDGPVHGDLSPPPVVESAKPAPPVEGAKPTPPVVDGAKPTPPAAEGAKPAPKTAADGGGAPEGDRAPAPQTWPEEWRKLLAGDDKKKIEKVARYTDPTKILDAYLTLERDLSSGAYVKKLPTHYSSEELAEWRKANGFPEKPEDYDTNLGNGIVWGENDKPHIGNFLEYAHANNMTPEQVKQGLGWWHQYQSTLVDQQAAIDNQNAAEARDQIRTVWGGTAQANLNFIKTVLDREPGMHNALMNARLPDGTRIGDNPKALNTLLVEFVKGDPYGADLPGNGSDAGKTVAAELAELRGLMADKGSRYWKGPEANTLQERFRSLKGMEDRIKAANAA